MNKKKKILFIIVLVLCLIIVGILLLYFTKDLRISKEDKIVQNLTSMGDEIYTEYYYPLVLAEKGEEETIEFLKNYEEVGLKFNLTELEKYSDDFKEKISKFKNKGKQCDKDNTKIIIYPKSPYGKTDYTSEIKLECGFKD